jgi:hypothetical protein
VTGENWHEERDRLTQLIEAVESGQVTHIDEADLRQLQATNPENVAALKKRLAQLNERLSGDEPEQDALFEIEGPDEDACVWIHSTDPRNPWTQNLGPRDKVAEVLSQWLGSIDSGENA